MLFPFRLSRCIINMEKAVFFMAESKLRELLKGFAVMIMK